MLETKVDPINPVLIADLSGFSFKSQSERLAGFAREALKEADRINQQALGFIPGHQTTADGTRVDDNALDKVKPDGTIVFTFATPASEFGWIADQLATHSPVKTGRYQHSHVFLRDGVIADPKSRDSETAGTHECMFVNVQAYSGKIERGESPQDPDGVYQAVAALAREFYGQVSMTIDFAYVDLPAAVIALAPPATTPSARRRKYYAHVLKKYPAIVIKLLSVR